MELWQPAKTLTTFAEMINIKEIFPVVIMRFLTDDLFVGARKRQQIFKNVMYNRELEKKWKKKVFCMHKEPSDLS